MNDDRRRTYDLDGGDEDMVGLIFSTDGKFYNVKTGEVTNWATPQADGSGNQDGIVKCKDIISPYPNSLFRKVRGILKGGNTATSLVGLNITEKPSSDYYCYYNSSWGNSSSYLYSLNYFNLSTMSGFETYFPLFVDGYSGVKYSMVYIGSTGSPEMVLCVLNDSYIVTSVITSSHIPASITVNGGFIYNKKYYVTHNSILRIYSNITSSNSYSDISSMTFGNGGDFEGPCLF